LVRNLIEPLRPDRAPSSPSDSIWWTAEECRSTFLESDALPLEFLAMYQYKVDRAWLCLTAELCKGRDLQWTRASQLFADRLPANMVFSELKNRLARPPLLPPLLGDSHAALLDRIARRERDGHRDRDKGGETELLDCSFTFPPADHFFPFNSNEKSLAGTRSSFDGQIRISDTVNEGDGSHAAVATVASRSSVRMANNDKNESKSKWISVAAKVSSILESISIRVNYLKDKSRSSFSATIVSSSVINKEPPYRVMIADVQSVIDEAISLPNFTGLLSNSKAEDDLAESLRNTLGDMTKVRNYFFYVKIQYLLS
jgi:predicted transcriptional regulator